MTSGHGAAVGVAPRVPSPRNVGERVRVRGLRGLSLLLTASLAAACEAPPVFPGADRRQNTLTARIEGQVVVTSAARGKVVLFLYDAARPPPPAGTGRPLAFTVLSRAAVFGDAEGTGPFVAPYAFSLVPAGSYLVRGFVDANDDFIPWYNVTADVNTGDVGGAAVDVVTHEAKLVEVAVSGDGSPVPALDVPVSFSDLARVPVDRPAFQASGGLTSFTASATAQTAVTLTLAPVDDGVVHEARPVFLAQLIDDGTGTAKFWPKVVVRKVSATDPLIDENDADKNGVLDATGADYDHVDPTTGATIPADGQPDLVVLAAGIDYAEFAPLLLDAMGRPKPAPVPVDHLKLVLQPRALDASDPARPGVLKQVPSGRYAVTLIQSTGQTWRLPNELTPDVANAAGLPAVDSQSFVIDVP